MRQFPRNPCRQFGWFVLFAMLGLLVAGGLMLPTSAPAPSVAVAIAYDERIDEVLSPTVRIRVLSADGNCSGSGVMIGDGLILTAAHLFFLNEDRDAVIIVDLFRYDENGEVIERQSIEACPVKVGDEKNDVALIRLKEEPHWAPAVAPLLPGGVSLRVFQEVYVVGCPKGIEPRITRGEISFIGERWDARFIGATADIFFGNSGGPLMVKIDGRWFVASILSRMEVDRAQALSWLAYYPHPDHVRAFVATREF
jgi:S1-C subfamily serine protease